MPRNTDFLQTNADISKIKKVLVPKGIFSETTCVYVRPKFQVFRINLTSFRQGSNFTPSAPLPPNEPLKSPPRLGLNFYRLSTWTRGYLFQRLHENGSYVWRNMSLFPWREKIWFFYRSWKYFICFFALDQIFLQARSQSYLWGPRRSR